MTTERIKEIQSKTAYPESVSVQQALLQVWNEVAQKYETFNTKEKWHTNEEKNAYHTEATGHGVVSHQSRSRPTTQLNLINERNDGY